MRTSSVNLAGLTRLLWSRRLLLAVFVIVATIISAGYALTRVPQFESDALLAQSKDETSQLGGSISGLIGQVAGLAGGLLQGQGTSVEESVAVLNSRDFALRFMREHGVTAVPVPEPVGRQDPELEDRSVSGTVVRLAARHTAVATGAATPGPGPSPDDAVQRFDRIRMVRRSIGARTSYTSRYAADSPQVAQAWATCDDSGS